MFITSDPTHKVYKDLLDFAFSVSDQFILVVRKDIKISRKGMDVLESLSAFLIEKREQFEWPGTRLGTGTDCFGQKSEPATVYYYKIHNEAKKVLVEASNSLHSWKSPNLPEDLSFIKNQKPWLINTAHEGLSYFETENQDEIEKILTIENLEVRTLNSLKDDAPKEIYINDPFMFKCIFCEGNFNEGDIAPETGWFVCLNCLNNGLMICNEDSKIFNVKSLSEENLMIDNIQVLKIADVDLLEYVIKNLINKKGVCSNKCLNLFYINRCIEHLQTYLALASREESTSELINMIKDNENIINILINKIDELKQSKQNYQ